MGGICQKQPSVSRRNSRLETESYPRIILFIYWNLLRRETHPVQQMSVERSLKRIDVCGRMLFLVEIIHSSQKIVVLQFTICHWFFKSFKSCQKFHCTNIFRPSIVKIHYLFHEWVFMTYIKYVRYMPVWFMNSTVFCLGWGPQLFYQQLYLLILKTVWLIQCSR